MRKNNDIGRSLALITQLGISMMVPIFLCLALGIWLDQKFGTWFTLPLLALGFAAGGRNAWILVKHVQKNQSTRPKKPEYDLMAGWKEKEGGDSEDE